MNNFNRITARSGNNDSFYKYDISKMQKSEIKYFKKVKKMNPRKITEKIIMTQVIDSIENLKANCLMYGRTFNKERVVRLLKNLYALNNQQINTVISIYNNRNNQQYRRNNRY
jgi:hypothetical protein